MNYFIIPSISIQGIENPTGKKHPSQKIITEVLNYYRFTWEQINKQTRRYEIKTTRQVIMYLLATRTNMTLRNIGHLFTHHFDHTTVIHARETIRDHITTGLLAKDINHIIEKLDT